MNTDTDAAPAKSRKPLLITLVLAGVLITAGAIFGFENIGPGLRDLLVSSLEWIEGLGVWGPIMFILIYVAACVLFIPGSLLTLGAGVLFGVVRGSIYVSIASTIGATACFLIGRYLARDAISKRTAGNPKFAAIDEAVAKEGWKIVGLTRLSPVFPFNLLNYGFGLTRVSLRDYVLASWIGMMPGTVMYVYLGSLAGDLATLGAGDAPPKSGAEWAIQLIGFAATVAVTVYVTRIAKRALAERVENEDAV